MKNRFAFFVFGIILVFTAVPASADLLTFGLDLEFSGATPPAGTAPWITATFDDSTGDPNSVLLTMSATNLVGAEFIGKWYFNFNPILDPSQLAFSPEDANASMILPSAGANNFLVAGGGYYDIEFDFPKKNSNRITSGEEAKYLLMYTSAISVSSFDFDSAPGGGNGTFRSAAHIQGIAPNGEESGWIAPNPNPNPVPEPATMLLFGVGLIGLAGFSRKKILRKN